nr:acetylglutamate kinase [Eudoraea chungangensis]
MKETLVVIKIGGNIIEDTVTLEAILDSFANLKGPKILVHGGGKKATELGNKLGITTTMVNGRRVTTSESLELAVMVYAGLVNKNIVAQLQGKGCDALGLSGADANVVTAKKRRVKEINFGYVGDVSKVNSQVISKFLYANISPVFCALSHDGHGQLLNTNADTIAAEIASSMSKDFEVTLFYCFEKKGVLKNIDEPDSVIKNITKESYKELLAANTISEGMLPKIDNCFYALYNKVSKVCIGNLHMIGGKEKLFTTISL